MSLTHTQPWAIFWFTITGLVSDPWPCVSATPVISIDTMIFTLFIYKIYTDYNTTLTVMNSKSSFSYNSYSVIASTASDRKKVRLSSNRHVRSWGHPQPAYQPPACPLIDRSRHSSLNAADCHHVRHEMNRNNNGVSQVFTMSQYPSEPDS